MSSIASSDTSSKKQALSPIHTQTLQALMQAVAIPSYRALATKAGISRWQIQQIRSGNISKLRLETLIKLSDALEIPLATLLNHFLPDSAATPADKTPQPTQLPAPSTTAETVQSEALQTLETWLIQWPTIAKRAQDRPDLPAAKLIPFIRPVEQLMHEWGVEPIATVDAQIPFNPQKHQLTQGTANPGDLVTVTHTGHTQNGKLLHRAKVKAQ